MTENHFQWHFSPFQINAQLFILFTKWLPAAILDDRKSLSIAFLDISDQCTTFYFVHKMAAGGHFGWPKITFDRISRHFRSIRNFFFHEMAAGGHFGKSLLIALLAISDQNATLFYFIFIFLMAAGGHLGSPIWAILDIRKSLFLTISDQYTPLFFFFFSKWPRRPFWSWSVNLWRS